MLSKYDNMISVLKNEIQLAGRLAKNEETPSKIDEQKVPYGSPAGGSSNLDEDILRIRAQRKVTDIDDFSKDGQPEIIGMLASIIQNLKVLQKRKSEIDQFKSSSSIDAKDAFRSLYLYSHSHNYRYFPNKDAPKSKLIPIDSGSEKSLKFIQVIFTHKKISNIFSIIFKQN